MTIKCIAVDDEPLALDIIMDYISRVPFLKLMRTFKDGISVLEYLSANTVDLIFLDIEMGGLTGTQLLKTLQKKPKVIMTTAYRKYAVDAFDLDVTDYLLKPFSFERFLKAVEKACNLIADPHKDPALPENQKDFIFVKSGYKMLKVNLKDIIYIEGLSEYIIIKTTASNIITLQSFKNIEKILPESQFIRIHKSYMIAIDKIDSIEGQCVVIAKKELPIGDKYKKRFFEVISLLRESR
ncbi:MAG TPA: response regulator transcription factor [Ignavibacteria bacterium]|nr:response regulator transcription factor [Ignavibacteria bacterium]HMQ98781.1 response regulator transcription factor [Ignavibacteria bacterium]